MEILKKFLQSLSEEGINFFIIMGSDPVNLDADEVIEYLSDAEAFEAEYFRKLKEERDEF